MIGIGILILGLLVVVGGVVGTVRSEMKSDRARADADADGEEDGDEDDSGRLMEKRVLYRRGFWRW